MVGCAACGVAFVVVPKFCPECGAPASAQIHRGGDERKVVTALFCDLVGFTAASEEADPEDVDRMLSAYFTMARAQIEAHGGAVQKFIGDAVVGVFGVPAAHEDDPERAVRAGLRITEDAVGLRGLAGAPLTLRVGVNTGEALVRLGVAPGSGEGFMAGDPINTASRLQSVAPEMGVAVGLATYEATAAVFDYEELSAELVKGKSAPLRVFHPKAPWARLGSDLSRPHDSAFVGREAELALLTGVFDESVVSNTPQLVTVVGEPGLGKSRIVAELFNHVDSLPGLVTWRQGRCLPYGEGITFWALGEIVKAHAGILETDPPEVATAKLEVVLPLGDERAWYRQRLLPLLGIEASSTAERGELFTAWRRFFEHVATTHPTVLVFEDLHWADPAMLGFIEHLLEHTAGVPLLLVATARPEFFDHHPDQVADRARAQRIELAPLSVVETERLVSDLLEATVLPVELQQSILERAGGNPLYAEEFVRFLRDKKLLTTKESGGAPLGGEEVPLPDSIQALIAARLDTLAPGVKSLLADAAVVGKVFWIGAVAAMSGREQDDVVEVLGELCRLEFVRRSGTSSMQGEAEYAFWHVLTRDVAYGQLPRASRVDRHVAAAKWIASKSPERVEDLADVLAHHFVTALDLARAAGADNKAADLEDSALHFLTLSGERALGLDAPTALARFQRALMLTPHGHRNRPSTLARLGEASFHAGEYVEAAELLEEAVELLRAGGELATAARSMAMLSDVLRTLGRGEWQGLALDAVALLEPLPPTPELVEVLTDAAASEVFAGRPQMAVEYAERALSLGVKLGLEPSGRALGFRGIGRALAGDAGGIADLRDALARASAAGQGREVTVLYNNLAMALWMVEGPRAGLRELRAGLAFAQASGLTESVDFATASSLSLLFDCGRFDELLAVADGIVGRLQSSADLADLIEVRSAQARVWTMRGQLGPYVDELDWLERVARESGDSHAFVDAISTVAVARACLGRSQAAVDLLLEVDGAPGIKVNQYFAIMLPSLTRLSLVLGDHNLAEGLIRGFEPRDAYADHARAAGAAVVTESRGEREAAADAYADAAKRWEAFGVVTEHAFALLGQGRCLVALGRAEDAWPVLIRAREIFEWLGAAPHLAETEALLSGARMPGSRSVQAAFLGEHLLDAPVGDDPQDGHPDEDRVGDPG